MTHAEISNLLHSGALFRRPDNQCLVLWGPWQPQSENQNDFQTGHQDFFSKKTEFFSAQRQSLVSLTDLKRALIQWREEIPLASSIQRPDFQEPDEHEFKNVFADLQGLLQAGVIKKAVPAVFATTPRVPALAERAQWLLSLLGAPANLFVYGWWDSEKGVLGATPEILFHQTGFDIQTMALAGTLAKKDQQMRRPLLEDPKELAEHRFVIDDLRNQLSEFGEVIISPTMVIELATLFHLCTPVQCRADRQVSVPELLRALHPTAALGVFPRSVDLSLLKNQVGQRARGFFGAPILFRLGPDEVIAVVAIRNIQWDHHGCRVGSGCGVVADSEAHREWSELAQKRDAVYRLVGL